MASAQTTSNTMSVCYRTVDGVRIRCAESDGPPDRTVVLTSPWPESVYAFAPIWTMLGRRFRLFAVDLPGFGASERRSDLLSPRAMGAFLVRVVDECELGRPHLVAPDVGTSAALFAAASSPRSLASVVVGSGGVAVPIALGQPLKGWVLDPDVERFRSVDSAAIVTAALDTVGGHVFPNAIREDYLESYAGDRFFESMRYARRYPDELPALAQLLPEIETPVLIFAGLRDRVVPLANAEFLAARIPRSRLTTIDSGHFVWEEASDEFAALIAAWVTGGHQELSATDD
ncbi:MAG: alpha/beta fold hydrolase [Solirubrobacteraceae bacterium]